MFNKVFNAFLVGLFGLDLFLAGAAFADDNTGSGVRLLVTAGLWGAILLMNFALFANRERRLEKHVDRAMDSFFAFIKEDQKRKEEVNAKHSSQKATANGTRAKSNAGSAKKKVSTVKKGVQNGKR